MDVSPDSLSCNDARPTRPPVLDVPLLLAGVACAGGLSAATGEAFGRPCPGRNFWGVGRAVLLGRSPIDSARATAQGAIADCAVFGSLGPAVLRTTRLQHPVPLVPRHGSREPDAGPVELQPPARALGRHRRGPTLLRRGRQSGSKAEA